MVDKHITRNVLFEAEDFQIVKRVQKERGLGGKGFSAAVRLIIRDWANLKENSKEMAMIIEQQATFSNHSCRG